MEVARSGSPSPLRSPAAALRAKTPFQTRSHRSRRSNSASPHCGGGCRRSHPSCPRRRRHRAGRHRRSRRPPEFGPGNRGEDLAVGLEGPVDVLEEAARGLRVGGPPGVTDDEEVVVTVGVEVGEHRSRGAAQLGAPPVLRLELGMAQQQLVGSGDRPPPGPDRPRSPGRRRSRTPDRGIRRRWDPRRRPVCPYIPISGSTRPISSVTSSNTIGPGVPEVGAVQQVRSPGRGCGSRGWPPGASLVARLPVVSGPRGPGAVQATRRDATRQGRQTPAHTPSMTTSTGVPNPESSSRGEAFTPRMSRPVVVDDGVAASGEQPQLRPRTDREGRSRRLISPVEVSIEPSPQPRSPRHRRGRPASRRSASRRVSSRSK